MALTRQQKSAILDTLKDKMTRKEAAVFVAYRGTSVKDMTLFRKELFKNGMDFQVAKKTLLALALKDVVDGEVHRDEMEKVPFGVVFGYDDQVSACKLSKKFSKDVETFEILGGVIGDVMVDKDVVIQYASLPSREESLAKIVGLMRAPLSGFHGGIKSSMSGFARAVSAYADTKNE